MNVYIELGITARWALMVVDEDGICWLWKEFDKLVEALDMARCLRMHVDNAGELPLPQYPLFEDAGPSFVDALIEERKGAA